MRIKIYKHDENKKYKDRELIFEGDDKDLKNKGFDVTQQENMKTLIFEWFLEEFGFSKDDLLEVIIDDK